jgi:predicted alpha/beta hydrolase
MEAFELPVVSADGHRSQLQARIPPSPTATLSWFGGMGIAARHYLPFADALAERGIAVFVHDWRGLGSSSVRASRNDDWGYRELLTQDMPACEAAIEHALPGLRRIVGGHSLGGQLASCRLGLAQRRGVGTVARRERHARLARLPAAHPLVAADGLPGAAFHRGAVRQVAGPADRVRRRGSARRGPRLVAHRAHGPVCRGRDGRSRRGAAVRGGPDPRGPHGP